MQFNTNLVKIHSALIKILPFLCFVLFLVTADGSHLGTQNCKKVKKSFMQRSLCHNVGRILLSFFSVSHLLFLVTEAILTGPYLIFKQLNARIVLAQVCSESIK